MFKSLKKFSKKILSFFNIFQNQIIIQELIIIAMENLKDLIWKKAVLH